MRLSGLMLAALAAPAFALAAPGAETWFIIVAENGDVVGHSSQTISATPDGREVIETSELLLQQSEDETIGVRDENVTRQDRAGRTIGLSSYSRNGRSWSRIEARIVDGKAEVVRRTPNDRRSSVVRLPAGVRFDSGSGLLAGWDPAKTPLLAFDNFSLSAMAVERVTIEPAPGTAPDPEGGITALRKRYDKGELRSVAKLQLDRRHRILAVTQPMFGTGVTVRQTDRLTALRARPPYPLLRNAMVKAPFRLPQSALEGRIRYRFAFAPAFDYAFPKPAEHNATPVPGGSILEICADCGPGLASDPMSLADALRSTPWLQSDHKRLRAIAAPISRMKVPDARKMELLIEKARPYLARIDFSGHFSALETLDRRAGDCTEAAVLLAALGRAAGIPTKVANGLAYSRPRYHGVSNVFMPHSWTLAWVGTEWRSFDLALDEFDSSHIALTIGDGDSRSVLAASQLASLLQWQDMAEIRSRPAT
jgi:transglutaminase-like putative cysteine protease